MTFLSYNGFVFAIVLILCSIGCHAETQIKWTPSDGDSSGGGTGGSGAGAGADGNAGPLPLSMKQRQQLLQLEQAIAQSPDPQATLEKVARSNQMSPEDLLSMLQRNRSDLQQSGNNSVGAAGSAPSLRNNALVKAVASTLLAANRVARRHPRLFAAAVAALLVSAHVARSAPRNGVVLSGPSQPRFVRWGHGPTTLWMPPAAYCRSEVLESDEIPWSRRAGKHSSVARSPLSLEDLSALFEPLRTIDRDEEEDEDDEDDSESESRPRKELQLSYQWLDRKSMKLGKDLDLRQAAVGQAVLTLEDLAPSAEPSSQTHRDIAPSLALDAARDLLRDQHLTEFCSIRYHSHRDRGVLVVPGMGSWGFVGLLPCVKAKGPTPPSSVDGDPEEDTVMHLALAAVPGYHWEGEVHVVVSLDDSDSIVVQAALIVPAHGRAVSRAVAKVVVSSIIESLLTSIKTRTRQSLSRSRQSATFQRRAKDKADQRRKTRQKKEREMEEMAADRRRRWQRQNPNSGHYRPSGDRMRSPNNAVYR